MRKIKIDGTVDVVCSDCGNMILRNVLYQGFSTAICLDCQKKRAVLQKEVDKQKENLTKK
ncbi:MAG: hypothetical protein KGN01_07245 [Patescibacteria group bacterium]|nr:hypothetical protein [Patescibacteria group bacterium]